MKSTAEFFLRRENRVGCAAGRYRRGKIGRQRCRVLLHIRNTLERRLNLRSGSECGLYAFRRQRTPDDDGADRAGAAILTRVGCEDEEADESRESEHTEENALEE